MNYKGTSGDDDLTGTSGNDVFTMTQGGNDAVHGGDGNDLFKFGATFDTGDFVDGGIGADKLLLTGSTYQTFFIGSEMLQNVETVVLGAGNTDGINPLDGVIAAGQSLTIDGRAVAGANGFSVDGSYMTAASADTTLIVYSGDSNSSVFTPGPGTNILHGGAGEDLVFFGGNLNSHDRINGGAGTNIFSLDGDYSAGLTFTAAMMQNFLFLDLAGEHSYRLAMNDGNVAAGETLTVEFQNPGIGETLIFNGSHETDGSFNVTGGLGNDMLTGGTGSDTLVDGGGGIDKLYGGDGDDTLGMGASMTAADHIDGGDGTDGLLLNGDYAAGLTFKATTIANLEYIQLMQNHSYKLTTVDANVAAGQNLQIDGSGLGAEDTLIFNGSKETDAGFKIFGGHGDDTLIGGQHGNTFDGSLGQDRITAGSGSDIFIYGDASDSTGLERDIITGFNAQHDKFDWTSQPVVDTAVTSGALGYSHFDANLEAAIGTGQLAADHAVLFTPDQGALAGHLFLVIDANGVAGYQAGEDIVIQIESATHMGIFGANNFI